MNSLGGWSFHDVRLHYASIWNFLNSKQINFQSSLMIKKQTNSTFLSTVCRIIVSECTSRYSDRQASYILSCSARCKIDLQTWATQQTLGIDACKRKKKKITPLFFSMHRLDRDRDHAGSERSRQRKNIFLSEWVKQCPVHQVTQSMFHFLDISKPPNTKQRWVTII